MQAKLRQTMAKVKCCVEHGLEGRFGLPSTLAYGVAGQVGDSRDAQGRPLFAAAGHVHGFPSAVDSYLDGLTNQVGFYNDVLPTVRPSIKSSTTTGSPPRLDGPGADACFGAQALAIGGGDGAIFMACDDGAVDTTARNHHPRRTRRFVCRCRPSAANPNSGMTTIPQSKRAVVGCFRTSSNGLLDTLTDGIYFYVNVDAAGLGNWRAVCMADGVATEVDLGVQLDVFPRAGAFFARFQIFEILYDGVEAVFGLTTGIGTAFARTVVAVISTHVPTSFVCGWGTACDQITPGNTEPQSWTFDGMNFVGHRNI